jgi:lysophospholipase L1-like esterase
MVKLSDKAVSGLRVFALITGLALIFLSLFADRIGLSVPGRPSRNQVMIAVVGLGLLGTAILGRRTPRAYQGFGLLLANLVLVSLAFELLSLFIIKITPPPELSLFRRKIDAGLLADLAQERMAWGRYEPYVVWRAMPSDSGEATDSDGYRLTPGSSDSPDAFRVFFFGGSAIWGCGVPDSSTIPSAFLVEASDRLGCPLEVMNLGQLGYVSSQEMISLCLELRDGSIPDLVIFMDGCNDVAAAYQSGIAGSHQNYPEIRARIEQRLELLGIQGQGSMLVGLLKQTNVYFLMSMLLRSTGADAARPREIISYRTMGLSTDSLASAVTDILLDNYSFVRALADEYGFEVRFYLQPTVWTGQKQLTEDETRFRDGVGNDAAIGVDPAFQELVRATYDLLDDSISNHADMCSLVGLFDGRSDPVYTDYTGVHLTPGGNQEVASAILTDVLDSMPGAIMPDSMDSASMLSTP